jgi:hypothetical protein
MLLLWAPTVEVYNMGYCEDKNVYTVMILSYPTVFLIYCLQLSILITGAVKTVGESMEKEEM